MDASAASWEVGAQCRRLSWLLHASVVEAKHAQLVFVFKAGFNPNQPRVPAGTADGGQWTGEWWRWWQQLRSERRWAHASRAECFLRSAARGATGAAARRQGSQSGN
jgi:hypothetical protein